MDSELFFGICILFVLCSVSTAAMAMRAPSRYRVIALLSVVLSVYVAYASLDQVLGQPKPVGMVPGWASPSFGPDGVTVVGASIAPDKTAFLMLQDGPGGVPRLWRFSASSGIVDGLKQAMEAHAKAHQGNPFGFKMTAAGPKGDGDGGSSNQGRPGQPGHGSGEQSIENRESPFRFEEPQPKALPPKP